MKAKMTLLPTLNVISFFVLATIGARVVFKLLGLTESVLLVSWIYSISQMLLIPFHGLTEDIVLSGGMVIDTTAIVGLLIYAAFFVIIYHFSVSVMETIEKSRRGEGPVYI